jgi:predicted signal transduction protein with EAL and GGDEF domain/FixJ family two-component response regulator
MSAPASTPLILLVDDDPTIRMIGSETLAAAGFNVVAAADGDVALAEFEQRRPAAVVLDVNMPGLDGFTVCERLRAMGHLDVPILIMTGQDDTAAIHRAYEAGATDFIGKPIRWAVLPYRLQYVLRASSLRQALAVSQQRTRALLDAMPDQIFLLDATGAIIEQINGSFESRSGSLPASEPLTVERLLPEEAARRMREHLHAALSTGQPATLEYKSPDAATTFEARLIPQPADTIMVIVRDVTERQRSEARIRQLAYFDSVTGLPNRQALIRELRRAMRHAKRNQKSVAVLYVDLDRFKRINDTFGHSVGDALLKAVASRLAGCVRPLDFIAAGGTDENEPAARIARLGGDEFVLLLTDLEVPEEAGAVARRVRQALSAPFTYEGRQFVVTPSIGVAIYPRDGEDVDTLLMRADTAMYQAKDVRNTVRFYISAMDAKALDRLRMEEELREAVAERRFSLHYQPKHSLLDGGITGAEALLRWQHAERGFIAPSQFIPLAEEIGLIVPLGGWVIDEACRQLQQWQQRGLTTLRLAINISAEQVARSDVANTTLRAIWKHGIRPQSLELEITETLLMQDVKAAKAMLNALKDAGASLAIDDFGTGYSSLSYLRQFPIDTLKIDRSFVQNIHSAPDDAVLCEAIVAMGKKLGLTVVAEGVELEEQRTFLAAAGCDQAQGFLFSRPLPADEFERYLNAATASRARA